MNTATDPGCTATVNLNGAGDVDSNAVINTDFQR